MRDIVALSRLPLDVAFDLQVHAELHVLHHPLTAADVYEPLEVENQPPKRKR